MRFEDLGRYDYVLPPELIRKKGVEPRDSVRLFVYDTKKDEIFHDYFYNLAEYLPGRALLVLNETRVVPARLWLKKETGGKIEVFVLANEISLTPRPFSEGRAVRGGGRMIRTPSLQQNVRGIPLERGAGEIQIPILVDRKCVPGMNLFFPNGSFFEIVRQEERRFFARLHSSLTPTYRPAGSVLEKRRGINSIEHLYHLLDVFGEMPVPHYLEGEEKESEDTLRKRYQTVFATTGASVAAPTASLHFTDRVFASLDAKGIDIAKVTLDVGLGTFAPLRVENFETKKLHREHIEVSQETADKLNTALGDSTSKSGRPIVAVGTTALRTLESIVTTSPDAPSGRGNPGGLDYQNSLSASSGSDRSDKKQDYSFCSFSDSTDIFIFPPHMFHSADILITNFHLPQTSLMLLVDAFLEHKGAPRRIIELYREAIKERYAFYSFGDSMLIL